MYIHYIITLHMYREYALKITFHSPGALRSQPGPASLPEPARSTHAPTMALLSVAALLLSAGTALGYVQHGVRRRLYQQHTARAIAIAGAAMSRCLPPPPAA
jgi:hypothetical protein